MKEISGSLGDRVELGRRRAGLTQAQLAVAAGMSVRTLRDIEHGQIRSPRSAALRRLTGLLGLSGDPVASLVARSAAQLWFGVLGPLAVRSGDADIRVGAPRLRAALAVLALQPGQPVSREELADAMWGGDPPDSSVSLLYTHVSRLRALTGAHIVLRGEAYCLQAASEQADVLRFHRLVAEANGAADPQSARPALEAALLCWRGPVLAGLDSRLRHHAVAVSLSGLRVRTALRFADLTRAAGQAEQAAELLEPVAEQEPLDEALQARLIIAMAAAGRRASALSRYDVVRRRLADDLGIDPGDELQAALQQVLHQPLPGRSGPRPSAVKPQASVRTPPRPAPAVPAQLPAGITTFTGRSASLSLLDSLLSEAGQPGTGVICTITGPAGVGKTSLALHWAHQVRGQFTDGQLYVNMNGFGPLEPVEPSYVLDQLLRSLDVPTGKIPAGLDAKAALLRSVLTGRRVLLVLDNARHPDQVRPLLPGGPPSLVLITSRSRLAGLGIREGAREVIVPPFAPAEAIDLLTRLAGADRAAAEPAALATIAERCGGLPLAIRIAGHRAARSRRFPLAILAEQLRDADLRLDELVTPDDDASSMRTVFSWSYQALSANQQRLFRQLALPIGPDISVAAAAALAGLPERRARLLLDALAGVNLLEQPAPGRYAQHDLIRTYAAELGYAVDSAASRDAALTRVISYYAGAAARAVRVSQTPDAAGKDQVTATDWLDVEMPSLIATTTATHISHPSSAMDLSDLLWRHLETHGRHNDAVILHACAVAAARESADHGRAGQALTNLGLACWRLGRLEEAVGHYRAALTAAGRGNERATRARALTELGSVCEHLGRYADGHEHSLRALQAAREIGDPTLQGRAVNNLGVLCWHQQRYADALERYQQANTLARSVGNRIGQANALANIGHCLIAMTRYTEALDELTAALALSEETGHVALQANANDSIALALRHLGRHDEAMKNHRQALRIARTTPDRNLEADLLNGFGETATQAGLPAEALVHHRQALAIASASGDRRQAARAHEGIAGACRADGNPGDAREHLEHAIAIYTSLGVPRAEQLRRDAGQMR